MVKLFCTNAKDQWLFFGLLPFLLPQPVVVTLSERATQICVYNANGMESAFRNGSHEQNDLHLIER